jgi:AcrR family transcriptional regulator
MKRSDSTEKKIIQAALELFVRKGYHGTSIEDITRQIGFTKGALYSHFNSKGELFLRLIEEFKTRFLEAMIRQAEEHPGNAVEKLHHIFSFNAGFAFENQDLVVFLTFLTTELKVDVEFEPALKKIYKEYQSVISQIIRQGIQEGLFRKKLDPDLAALAFIAMHDGILHQWVLNRDNLDGKKYVSTFRRIFLQGLEKWVSAPRSGSDKK